MWWDGCAGFQLYLSDVSSSRNLRIYVKLAPTRTPRYSYRFCPNFIVDPLNSGTFGGLGPLILATLYVGRDWEEYQCTWGKGGGTGRETHKSDAKAERVGKMTNTSCLTTGRFRFVLPFDP